LLAERLHWLPFDFLVLYVSFERWVFVRYRRNHRNYFWEGLNGMNVFFVSASIFLKVIEKFVSRKYRDMRNKKV